MKSILDILFTIMGILLSRYFERYSFFSKKEIAKYQTKLIKKQLDYATKNISFYKNLNISIKKDPLETLVQFPVVSKEDIIENPESFRPKKFANYLSSVHFTSGISGQILKSDCSPFAWIVEQAAIWNHWRSAKYKFRDEMLILRGFNPKEGEQIYKKNKFRNWLFFSPRHLNEADLDKNIEIIINFCPKFIRGYPSSIKQFAIYCFQNDIKFSNLKGIFTASETLKYEDRVFIEKIFSAPIFDHYGQAEITCLFHECNEHKGLHVVPYYGYVEFIPDNLGNFRIVATNLRNKYMPLIRYDTGDIVENFINEKCPCSRKTLRISSIKGRGNMMLIDKYNQKFSSTSLITFLSSFPSLIRFQIIQKEDSKIDFIYLSKQNLDLNKLEKYLKDIFGNKINFKPNENFYLSKDGKFSSIVII